MKNTVRRLFTIWQGHQITDEEIYNSEGGKYPIVTGHNEVKGYTSKPRITDVPCITIPSKGIVDSIYIQSQPFDANNTITMVPRDRKEILPEFVAFTQSGYITQFVSSRDTNNYLNREILENIIIAYPDIDEQIEVARRFGRLVALRESLRNLIRQVDTHIGFTVTCEGEKVNIPDEFNLEVGHDDGLTEAYAYNHTGNIPIYSGAADNGGVFGYTDRIDYDHQDYLTWSIDGKAGTLFRRHGPCCLARHCGIMIPKSVRINLDWFILTQQTALQQFALGRGGLGNLKKNRLEMFSFIRPLRDVQDRIVEEYGRLLKIRSSMMSSLSKIDALWSPIF